MLRENPEEMTQIHLLSKALWKLKGKKELKFGQKSISSLWTVGIFCTENSFRHWTRSQLERCKEHSHSPLNICYCRTFYYLADKAQKFLSEKQLQPNRLGNTYCLFMIVWKLWFEKYSVSILWFYTVYACRHYSIHWNTFYKCSQVDSCRFFFSFFRFINSDPTYTSGRGSLNVL